MSGGRPETTQSSPHPFAAIPRTRTLTASAARRIPDPSSRRIAMRLPTLIAAALLAASAPALAQNASECTKTGLCYCAEGAVRKAVDDAVTKVRAEIAEALKAGKAVGCMSAPVSIAGGGHSGVNGDVARIEAYFDERIKTDASLQRAVSGNRPTRESFRNYYALKGSVAFSRGSSDEWNIVSAINDRRRADSKFGIPNQIAIPYDGRGIQPGAVGARTAEGYTGKCP
jgi:hypothetical protein